MPMWQVSLAFAGNDGGNGLDLGQQETCGAAIASIGGASSFPQANPDGTFPETWGCTVMVTAASSEAAGNTAQRLVAAECGVWGIPQWPATVEMVTEVTQ